MLLLVQGQPQKAVPIRPAGDGSPEKNHQRAVETLIGRNVNRANRCVIAIDRGIRGAREAADGDSPSPEVA